jgi:hypothetical protein
MQTIVKETGSFTGFRRSDLMHDKTFVLKHWTGEPLLWMPYESGTHLMRVGNMTVRQRNEAMKVIDHMLTQQADAHFYLIEGPGFPPREIPPRMIRDEAMDLFEGHTRSESYEDEREGLERNANSAQYWVWILDRDNMPLGTEGPWGPYDAQTARTYARIGATEGTHERAVSRGKDPKAGNFEIMRIYRAGSGEHIYAGGGVAANASKPQAKFQLGDRVRIKGLGRKGTVSYIGDYDEYTEQYRYKVLEDDGTRLTWNENSLSLVGD